ncbi:protein shisa-like-1 [Tympanuchus pallidicinctus]|uniref:protein shisa-like-1 n=1 Tax=Tympanuchus pallidicinctus TaxID=109042 RepID=UPI0022874F27|nr:protein shisa-like-1 [Tympanuchus pallidicinctus]
MAGKMLGGLLLLAAAPGVLGTASLQKLHLCEGYAGPDGRYHPGFYCPRLTDPATHRYCCQPGPHALKGCCSRLRVEALTGLNISGLPAPGLLRHPLALPFVGLYGLLVLLLVALDLAHFYRTQRCALGRRLPRARCLPCRSPSPAAAAPRAAGGEA